MTGFEGECLHVFNKHASSAVVAPYFQREEVRALSGFLLFFCFLFLCATCSADLGDL